MVRVALALFIAVESIWARPSAEPSEYKIPFFTREATIGDTVKVQGGGWQRWFDCVVKRSTNSLIRVVFFYPDFVNKVKDQLVASGCSIEFLRAYNLMAVDTPVGIELKEVQKYLEAETANGSVDYEEPIVGQ